MRMLVIRMNYSSVMCVQGRYIAFYEDKVTVAFGQKQIQKKKQIWSHRDHY